MCVCVCARRRLLHFTIRKNANVCCCCYCLSVHFVSKRDWIHELIDKNKRFSEPAKNDSIYDLIFGYWYSKLHILLHFGVASVGRYCLLLHSVSLISFERWYSHKTGGRPRNKKPMKVIFGLNRPRFRLWHHERMIFFSRKVWLSASMHWHTKDAISGKITLLRLNLCFPVRLFVFAFWFCKWFEKNASTIPNIFINATLVGWNSKVWLLDANKRKINSYGFFLTKLNRIETTKGYLRRKIELNWI